MAGKATLFARLPANLHLFLHELLPLARAYTTLDDVEHYQTTRLTLPLRKGLRELGHRLVLRGVLGEPMDAFFFRFRAIDAATRAGDDVQWDQLAVSVRAKVTGDAARSQPKFNTPRCQASTVMNRWPSERSSGCSDSSAAVAMVTARVSSNWRIPPRRTTRWQSPCSTSQATLVPVALRVAPGC